ncbi:winged helix-turn-helix domain-containing protein [Oleiagrimonas citrea]|uniref:Helix-turn-helix transcriptional regulator n=1 Tax=Oleiagrimonas citrea TaxID=1665687 RepID=A0A846ZMF4_9GAMM|nr:metalloregulator ArsR/SmtB family transcription factor [Oleiagrimonas citrea]NKZ38633.1 helix-turn-helix transcriptional regulator [Oleiagrimonas citrea]
MAVVPTRYQLAEIGSLLADPSRAAILLALADGRARPAGELARMARIAPSTASAHLARLVAGGLLSVLQQGRHRYFRIADDTVAHALETLPLMRPMPRDVPVPASQRPLQEARTCYRHLAGRLGVALHDRLRECAWIELGERAVHLSTSGLRALTDAGLLTTEDSLSLAGRQCLDWTERRFHLGGPLGVMLTARMRQRDWLRPCNGSRALRLTPTGRAGLNALGVALGRQ